MGEGSHEEAYETMDVFTLLVVLIVLRSLPMESSTSNPHCPLLHVNDTTIRLFKKRKIRGKKE